MKIEWASSFLPDGTRIRPPPSKMHGWILKMRGTLTGNETVRSQGIHEMKNAGQERKRWEEWRARQVAYRGGAVPQKKKGILSLLGLGKNKDKASPRRLQSTRPSGSSRPSHHSSNSHGSRAVKSAPKSGSRSYRSSSSRSERRPTNSHRSGHRSSHRR